MYFSPTFVSDYESINLYDDLSLIPLARPWLSPPKPKTTYVEIPGASGSLDLSEALTRYPVYSDRTGSWQFIVDKSKNTKPWYELYSDIMYHIHGRRLKVFLEDDKDWYYEGRFDVGDWTSYTDGSGNGCTIAYVVSPYKKYKDETTIDISSSSSSTWTTKSFKGEVGVMPVVPMFNNKGNGALTIQVQNPEIGLDWTEQEVIPGSRSYYNLVLSEVNPGNDIQIRVKGNGTLSVTYRKGAL